MIARWIKQFCGKQTLEPCAFYALDIHDNSLHVFYSEEILKQNCEGLSIAEGDWRFFAKDGSPMEAVFTKPARIFAEKNTYTHGEYFLRPTAGDNLVTFFPAFQYEQGLTRFRDLAFEQKQEEALKQAESKNQP